MTTFGELPEDQATGQIAEIYGEIRTYGAVPYVSSLQRQLATVPGCLEWLWGAVRPAFIDGRLPKAAWGAVQGLDLPVLKPVQRPKLRAMGVDGDGETVLHGIYETFLRASPVNMVTASLMGHLLAADAASEGSVPAGAPSWQPPVPPPPLPGFPTDAELGVEGTALLNLFTVDMDGSTFVPGLYRLLAHWPGYLAHVAVEILPLFQRPDIMAICHEIVERIDAVVPPFTRGLTAAPKPFDATIAAALRGSLGVYRGTTSPQMIVFSTLLRDALPGD
jgi:hypothetical protein